MGLLLIIIAIVWGAWKLKHYMTPKNPFPLHSQYVAAWNMLSSPAEKRDFSKKFRVTKSNEIVVMSTKTTYKMLLGEINNTDVFNYCSLGPKLWSMDYYTPFAALRVAGLKKKGVFTKLQDFEDLIDNFPQKKESERLRCFITLFGLYTYGSIDPKTKLRVSSQGEMWVAIIHQQLAYKLHFTATTVELKSVNPMIIKDNALPTLISQGC